MHKTLTGIPQKITYSLSEAATELNLSSRELVYYGSLEQVELCWSIPSNFAIYNIFLMKGRDKAGKEIRAIAPRDVIDNAPHMKAIKTNVNALVLKKSDCHELLLHPSFETKSLFSSGYIISKNGLIEKVLPWKINNGASDRDERFFAISLLSTSIIHPFPFKQEIIKLSFDGIIVVREQLELLKNILNNNQTTLELETTDDFYTHERKSQYLVKLEQAAKDLFGVNSKNHQNANNSKYVEKYLIKTFGFSAPLAKIAAIIISPESIKTNDTSDTHAPSYRSEKFRFLIHAWNKHYANADSEQVDTYPLKSDVAQWFRKSVEFVEILSAEEKRLIVSVLDAESNEDEVQDLAFHCSTLIRSENAPRGRRRGTKNITKLISKT